jgi:phosphate/sulfate permease
MTGIEASMALAIVGSLVILTSVLTDETRQLHLWEKIGAAVGVAFVLPLVARLFSAAILL